MKKILWMLSVLVAALTFAGPASAGLMLIGTANYQGTDYNLIFEGTLGGEGLVWLDYTNTEEASWDEKTNWASGLGADLTMSLDPFYTTTIDWSMGWRLPATAIEEQGRNIITSEMGHLYYVSLGNSAGGGLTNTGDFEHLMSSKAYWSGTEYSTDETWYFNFSHGYQNYKRKTWQNHYTLAVHTGEVSASATPIPGAALLLGSGLVGLISIRRRKALKRIDRHSVY